MNDLDQVHRELSELRLRTFGAPTLRDAVARPEPAADARRWWRRSAPRPPRRWSPWRCPPALSMAG